MIDEQKRLENIEKGKELIKENRINHKPETYKPMEEKSETKPQIQIIDCTPTKSTRFDEMLSQAKTLLDSGLLPTEIKTPSAALAIMLTGQEIGIPVMQSLRSIYIVKGKPTLSAQLIGGLIFKHGHKYLVKESTDKICTLEFIRQNEKPVPYTFTWDDAVKAKLTDREQWKMYPKAMLFSRCMSAGARLVMPDVIAGLYTPEELSEKILVDDETGEVKPVG